MNNKCSVFCRWVSLGQSWQDSSEDISGAGEKGLPIYTALSLLRPHPLEQRQTGGGGWGEEAAGLSGRHCGSTGRESDSSLISLGGLD